MKHVQYLPVVAALAETILPALPDKAAEAEKQGLHDFAQLQAFGGSSQTAQVEKILNRIETRLTPESQKELFQVFELLRWRLGTLLLCGFQALVPYFPFVGTFAELPRLQREVVLQTWATSSIGQFRKAFRALQMLIMSVLATSVDDKHRNPMWPAMGYPGPTVVDESKINKKTREAHWALEGGLVNLGAALAKGSSPAELRELAASRGLHVHDPLRPEGEELEEEAGAGLVVSCDAVIVGSGAGAGPVAAQLAEAGLKVVLLEKGIFTPTQQLSLTEGDAVCTMYENDGLVTTEDGNILIWAGSTVGGGTRINWCVSFRTPDHVRQEWADKNGLPSFTSDRYVRAMDAVCSRLGVSEEYTHNKQNAAMMRGLDAIGLKGANMPRNCLSQDCGHCCLGCATGDKQDMTSTFLADAARHGAKIVTGIYADKIITTQASHTPTSQNGFHHETDSLLSSDGRTSSSDSSSNSNHAEPAAHSRKLQAKGVVAYLGGGSTKFKCVFKAPLVIASAGSIHSPALLLRSGITVNGNVGKHLRLHPAGSSIHVFPEVINGEHHGKMNMWDGPMMTAWSPQSPDWDGKGYGPMVSCPSIHPGLFASAAPWLSGAAFKQVLSTYSNAAVACTYTRDVGSGQVKIDKDGRPRLHYVLGKADQENIWKGLETGIRAMAAAGAEIVSNGGNGPDDRLYLEGNPQEDRPKLEKFLNRFNEAGYRTYGKAHLSMHQMGSCRQGSSPNNSVTDGEGHCWDVANLYVADASAFPTATGVNPMITTESIAYMVGEGMAAKYSKLLKRRSPVKLQYES